jgi:hypothetical protein
MTFRASGPAVRVTFTLGDPADSVGDAIGNADDAVDFFDNVTAKTRRCR